MKVSMLRLEKKQMKNAKQNFTFCIEIRMKQFSTKDFNDKKIKDKSY